MIYLEEISGRGGWAGQLARHGWVPVALRYKSTCCDQLFPARLCLLTSSLPLVDPLKLCKDISSDSEAECKMSSVVMYRQQLLRDTVSVLVSWFYMTPCVGNMLISVTGWPSNN